MCADATDLRGLRVADAGTAPEIIICVDDVTSPALFEAVRQISPEGTISVVVREPSAAAAAVAAGARTAISLSDLAGQLLAESAYLPRTNWR